MGNQIVCPSGQSWFLSDFEKMGITIDHSIYDGTFLLSFKAVSNRPKRSLVVKAFKIPSSPTNDDKDATKSFDTYKQSALNVINNSKAYFEQLNKEIPKGFIANQPVITDEGVYMSRPFIHDSLPSRMNDFPELTVYEKDWIAYQIIRDIIGLHSKGFHHGDIKPENILLTERLQALIVDFAPYKPIFINKTQPNFFLHYFNYEGDSAYIAPERVVTNFGKKTIISLLKCDLFSLGCLLAYLYLGGKSLFTFTSIQEYKNGGEAAENLLKPLETIKDEKKRDLIKMLLSVNPKERELSLDLIDGIFPKWFDVFYDFFYEYHLDTAYMEVTLTLHEEVMKMLPEDLGEGSLIYFNILSDVILSSGRLSTLNLLINHYVAMTTKYFDTEMKLSRAIPTLFEIFERRVNVASIYAFDGITKIFDSIDEIPEDFSNYHRAFLLPRLAAVLEEGWASVFVCELPKWSLSMHRLWPTFYSDLRSDVSICQYLFTVNSTIIASESPSLSDIGFIKAYLKKCKEASEFSSFDFLATLSFFLFPLLSTSIFLPDIVDMICTFYNKFNDNQKTKFFETIEDPLFISLLSSQIRPNQAVDVLLAFRNVLSIKMKEIYKTQLAMKVIKLAREGNVDVKAAAKSVIENFPVFYQKLFFAAISNPIEYTETEEPQTQEEDVQEHKEPEKTTFVTDAELFIKFFSSKNVGSFVNEIFFVDRSNIFVVYDNKGLQRYSLSLESKPFFKEELSYSHYNKIYCIQKVGKTLFCYSDLYSVFFFDSFDGMVCSFKTPAPVVNITYIDESSYALIYANSSIVEIRSISTFELKKTLEFGKNPISFIKLFDGTPFFFVCDVKGNVIIVDKRINLPIISTKHEGIFEIVPLKSPDFTFAMVSKESVVVFNCSSPEKKITIEGDHGSVVGVENILYIADKNGTFYIDTENPSNSYSLYESGKKEKINVDFNDKECHIQLPKETLRTLCYHNFQVTCGCYCEVGLIVTGDSHGFINMWLSANI